MIRSTVFLGPLGLPGDLTVPEQASSLVIFAHGSGSSRISPRNREVAATLQSQGLATLLMDLLTPQEAQDRRRVFDIPLLARRLTHAIDWAQTQRALAELPVGLFGASTGAAAALVAAALRPRRVCAVVSRGGRPDLARGALPSVTTPTLMIVGGADRDVLELNRHAILRMRAPVSLRIVPGATHLFEETGALERVAALAARWFLDHAPEQTAAVTAVAPSEQARRLVSAAPVGRPYTPSQYGRRPTREDLGRQRVGALE